MCCVIHKNVQWLIGLEKRIWIHISFFFIPAFFFRSSAVALASPPLCMEGEAALVTIWWSPGLFPGFPTRMGYLYYISCLRYAILIGNPRFAPCTLNFILLAFDEAMVSNDWVNMEDHTMTQRTWLSPPPPPSLSLTQLVGLKKAKYGADASVICASTLNIRTLPIRNTPYLNSGCFMTPSSFFKFPFLHCISIRVCAFSLVFIPVCTWCATLWRVHKLGACKNETRKNNLPAMYLYT